MPVNMAGSLAQGVHGGMSGVTARGRPQGARRCGCAEIAVASRTLRRIVRPVAGLMPPPRHTTESQKEAVRDDPHRSVRLSVRSTRRHCACPLRLLLRAPAVVGLGQADAIAKVNPLRRVPVLVLESGEVLVESSAILDAIDEMMPPEQALLPRTAPPGGRASACAASRRAWPTRR